MTNYTGYTTAELNLQVVLHEEGRVTQPAKVLKALRAEIARRRAAPICDATLLKLGGGERSAVFYMGAGSRPCQAY